MSRWIRRLAVVLALVALVVLGARAVVGHATRVQLETALKAFEREHGARLPADLAPPSVPETENVAPVLMDLIDELETEDLRWRNLAGRVAKFQSLPPIDWSEEQLRIAHEFAASCGPIDRFRDLAARKRSDFEIDYSKGWSTLLPPFVRLLIVGRCALIRGQLGLLAGDLDIFLVTYSALGNISAGLLNEPLLISQILSIGIKRQQHCLLHPALERGALDLEVVEAILGLGEGPSVRAGIARGLEAHALMVASTPSRLVLEVADDKELSMHLPSVEKVLNYLLEPRGDLIRLATIDNRSREIEALEHAAAELFRRLDDGSFYDAAHRRRDQLAPDIEDILLKAYAADTANALARTALEVARDVASSHNEPMTMIRADPMSGESLTRRATSTHVVVSAPGAAAIWDDRAGFTGNLPPIFEWPVALVPPAD